MTEERNSSTPRDTTPLDVLIILAKRKRLIAGVCAIGIIVAVAISYLLPVEYTGTARIMPPQQSASAAATLLNQVSGSMGGLAGAVGTTLSLRNPSDIYVSMLKSRGIADRMVERFALGQVYNISLRSDIRDRLARKSAFSVGREGIITIEVDDKDPKLAAALTNGYVEELKHLTQALAVTEASQRRLFFEQQLEKARDTLAASELAAKESLEKGGIAQVEAHGRSLIEVTARLRAQISTKEVQVATMKTFAAENNPQLQTTLQELAALKHELGRIEGALPRGVPERNDKGGENSGISSLQQLRQMRYYETIYGILARQYELARMDEAKDAVIIQLLDPAIVPEKRSRPQRSVVVLIVTFIFLTLAIILAFIREYLERAGHDPEFARKMSQMRGYLLSSSRPAITD